LKNLNTFKRVNGFKRIWDAVGSWAAGHPKAVITGIVLCTAYGFFPVGIETPRLALTLRSAILGIFILLVLSLYKKKSMPTAAIEKPEVSAAEYDSVSEKGIIQSVSESYALKDRRDTEKEYLLFLSKLLTIIKKTFSARSAVIYLLEKNTQELRIVSYVSSDEPVILKDRGFKPTDAIFFSIFEHGESYFSNDPRKVQSLLPYYQYPIGSTSAIAVPLIIHKEFGGTLIIDSQEQNAYSEDDVLLVETYGGIIAESIVNYTNLIEFEYSSQLFSFFYEVSRGLISNLKFDEILDLLVSVMKNLLQYDRLTVSTYETGNEQAKIIRVEGQTDDFPAGTTFNLEDGLNGWIIRKRKAILIQNLEKDEQFIPRYTNLEKTNYGLRSFLGAPICYHNICFGSITVEHRMHDFYTEKHEKILIMLANNFGVALERSHALQQLELQATIDALTDLNNYRTFLKRITEEVERAVRYGSRFTLLMLDLDHFKEVNDQYGHLAGDKVLIQIAAGLKRSVRTVDFVARYGGEEFAIILVETELDKGIYTAERIRSYIEKIETYYKGDIITVTVSIGAAKFPNSSKDFETIIAEADKALYQAKTGGRNRVVAYHGEAETNINNYNQSGN